MGTNGATKVPISRGDVAEDSETTVEIKIKTLDSQTYTLRVNKCVPVPALKEQIATVTGVLSEQQRLICRGKVLKDDQLLSAYHVEDGHTLHLVVRQPHHSSSPSTSYVGSEGASGHPATTSASGSARGNQVARSFVFETVNVDQGDIDTSVLSRIISSMLDTIGTTSTGTGNTTNDHREMGSERLARASSDIGLPNSNPPQPNSTTTRVEFDRRQADFRFPSSVPMGPQNPLVIPDSLTTLYQYIGLMRDELRREGFADANGREHSNNAEAAGLHVNEGQSQDFQSHPSSAQGGLPSAASLAEILLSTRQLLMEQAGECLLQLARQLEDHTTVTDLPTRMNIQSSAMRSGVLMQKLGSLLLELGRTTMTLRMGQTPSEAVVNAGPANFISASGPNPMMVQPVPFYPGSNFSGMQMGTVNSGHNSLEGEPTDAAILPRNIEIRIRTGRAVPVASANVGEQAGAPQPQGQTDPTRNSSGANVVHQALSAISGGESGVRVVPIRTVVAMPTGVNQSPSDSSGSSVRLFYPLLARIRQPSTGDASDARGSQASSQPNLGGPEIDHQPILESAEQRQNLESNGGAIGDDNRFPANTVPLVSGMSPPANESADYQESSRVFIPSQQRPPNNNRVSGTQTNDGTTRDVESHEAAGVGSEQGLFFSSVLRQVIPLISQGREPGASPTNPSSSTAQTERENLNGSSSSQHCRDPPEAPSPKRPKRKSD